MTGRRVPTGACWLLAGAVLAASTATIRVTPVIADGQVSASVSAAPSFDDDDRAVVQSGLLLTMTYTLELKRPSAVWWDRTISTTTVASSVKFDNLTAVYQVSKSQDGHVTWSERTDDLNDVRTWMTTFERVPLGEGERLEPNAEYYVQVHMRASPRRTFSLWPFFGSDDGIGRADFTFIR